MKIKTLLLVTALINAGCSSSASSPEQFSNSYSMRVSQRCFCPQKLLGPFDITVIDGVTSTALRVSDGAPVPLKWVGNDIPDLAYILRQIRQAQSQQAHLLEVKWLRHPYVPEYVHIDFSTLMADDEVTYVIERFKYH